MTQNLPNRERASLAIGSVIKVAMVTAAPPNTSEREVRVLRPATFTRAQITRYDGRSAIADRIKARKGSSLRLTDEKLST